MKTALRLALAIVLALSTNIAAGATVTLRWDANVDGGITAGYKVRARVGSTLAGQLDAGLTTTNTIGGLTAGTTYAFSVSAYNSAGVESPESAPVTYTIPIPPPPVPGTPKNVRLVLDGPSIRRDYQATAAWSPVTDADHYTAVLRQAGQTVAALRTKRTTATFKRVPQGSTRLELFAHQAARASAPAIVEFTAWPASVGNVFVSNP